MVSKFNSAIFSLSKGNCAKRKIEMRIPLLCPWRKCQNFYPYLSFVWLGKKFASEDLGEPLYTISAGNRVTTRSEKSPDLLVLAYT